MESRFISFGDQGRRKKDNRGCRSNIGLPGLAWLINQ